MNAFNHNWLNASSDKQQIVHQSLGNSASSYIFRPQGWICPKCGAVHAPSTWSCYSCNASKFGNFMADYNRLYDPDIHFYWNGEDQA